jgi:hypothetical protein
LKALSPRFLEEYSYRGQPDDIELIDIGSASVADFSQFEFGVCDDPLEKYFQSAKRLYMLACRKKLATCLFFRTIFTIV